MWAWWEGAIQLEWVYLFQSPDSLCWRQRDQDELSFVIIRDFYYDDNCIPFHWSFRIRNPLNAVGLKGITNMYCGEQVSSICQKDIKSLRMLFWRGEHFSDEGKKNSTQGQRCLALHFPLGKKKWLKGYITDAHQIINRMEWRNKKEITFPHSLLTWFLENWQQRAIQWN